MTEITTTSAAEVAAETAEFSAANGTVGSDFERMIAEIRDHDRFLLTAHEGPDGDALGSLLGMHHLLTKLGKDSVMFLAAKEFPLPIEYRFLPLENVFHEAPADMADRVIMFLDCGNIDRMPVPFLTEGNNRRLNIDHHHDNTRFGDVNLVAPKASCTAEIVYDIAHVLGVPIDAEMAMPLYVGLITDTGKFMYENTNAHTHRVAAELIDAGVSVDDTYRRLYEHVPIEKLRLVARALDGIQISCGGRLAISYITAEDYAATGSGEEMTEGVIDHLRSIDGIKVAAVIRGLGNRGRAARKASLRSSEGDVDVSAIARKQGGGGHKRAAGFSTDDDLPTLVDFLCGEVTTQLGD
jgi:bifunctional oligoribonuclease and PAP phosphatase NrnA